MQPIFIYIVGKDLLKKRKRRRIKEKDKGEEVEGLG